MSHKKTSLGSSLNKINPLKQPKSAGRWPNNAININLYSYETSNSKINPLDKKISEN